MTSYVFSYKTYVFAVSENGTRSTVRIRQHTSTHIWTVNVETVPNVAQTQLAEAALEAWRNQQEDIIM